MNSQATVDDLCGLKEELKAVKARCINTYQMIENAPPEAPCINENEVTSRTNNYVEGVRREIRNSNTRIITNDKILVTQFLNELKQKNTHIDELTCLTKAYICEQELEIDRLKSLINSTKEALSKPKQKTTDIKPEHVLKAREKFCHLKEVLHGLMQSLFPDCYDEMMALMGDLMKTTSSYLEVTPENYSLAVMLRDMNIVTVNPYNDYEIKLIYF